MAKERFHVLLEPLQVQRLDALLERPRFKMRNLCRAAAIRAALAEWIEREEFKVRNEPFVAPPPAGPAASIPKRPGSIPVIKHTGATPNKKPGPARKR